MSNSFFKFKVEKLTNTDHEVNDRNNCYPADCQPDVCIPSCEDVDDRTQNTDYSNPRLT